MGKLDTQSTAAVGIVFSLMAIIQAIVVLFGHGSGNFISRKLGAGDIEEAEKMSAVGFFTSFLAGVAIMVGCMFLSNHFPICSVPQRRFSLIQWLICGLF